MPTRPARSFDPATTIDVSPADIEPPPELGPPAPNPTAGPPARPSTSAAARISGLAGLCMLVLVVSGLGLPLPGGHLAVDAVLVVIGMQLGTAALRAADRADERETGGSWHWISRFWARNLAPIAAPAAMAVALAATYWWWLDRLGSTEATGALTALALVANLAPLASDAAFVATDHLWLVAAMAQFTLLVPVAVLVTRREGGPKLVLRGLIVIVAVLATTRLTVAATGLDDDAVRTLAVATRFDGLLIGLGLALAKPTWPARVPRSLAAPAFTILLAVFALAPDARSVPVLTLGLLAPLVVAATAVIAATRVAGNPDDALGRTLGTLGLRWLGTRAISIYVWHQLFGMALDEQADLGLFGADWPGSSLFTTRLVFALAAGAASYRYLQVPVRTVVTRGRRRRVGPADGPIEPPGRTALSPS